MDGRTDDGWTECVKGASSPAFLAYSESPMWGYVGDKGPGGGVGEGKEEGRMDGRRTDGWTEGRRVDGDVKCAPSPTFLAYSNYLMRGYV